MKMGKFILVRKDQKRVASFCESSRKSNPFIPKKIFTVLKVNLGWSEMEYCASAASMLAEEIWQIAEGFVEVPVNLLVQLKKCGKNIPND